MKPSLTCFLLFFTSIVFAQSDSRTIRFLDKDGQDVTQEKADYYRITQRDQSSGMFLVEEYYPSKVKKLEGKSSKAGPILTFEGPITWYDRMGRISKVLTFQGGSPKGSADFYYPNGRIYKTVLYGEAQGMIDVIKNREVKYRVIHCYDSTGNEVVMNGQTLFKDWDEERQLEESGFYKDGLKTGLWKGSYIKTGDKFEEEYSEGQLISGRATWSNGERTTYTKVFEQPVFKGGDKAFQSYFARSFKWPPSALRTGMSGEIVFSFMVDKEGAIRDLKVIKSLSTDVDLEAFRVIKSLPRWLPGRDHGALVSTSYNLPIRLSISGGY